MLIISLLLSVSQTICVYFIGECTAHVRFLSFNPYFNLTVANVPTEPLTSKRYVTSIPIIDRQYMHLIYSTQQTSSIGVTVQY